MSIYAIGDLHLSYSENKPMNIFGNNWEEHELKIKENWIKKVKQDDLVILPGDFSWSMKLEDTKKDFEYLNNLPGKKILIKGNHDYWWQTLKSMEEFIENNKFKNIQFLNNNAFIYENSIIVGTRGWSFTDSENSEKMHKRETARLENSILQGINMAELKNDEDSNNIEIKNSIKDYRIICVMHYPPITKTMVENGGKSQYIDIMKKYNIQKCIYGHLHGKAHSEAVEGIIDDVQLQLVSSDYIKFDPVLI